MALTVIKFARRIRVTDDEPTGTLLEDLTDLLQQATHIVNEYAPGAPEIVRDGAIVRVGAFLQDAPPLEQGTQNALRASGAAAMLSRYRVHRIGLVSTGAEAPGEGGPGGLNEVAITALIRRIVPEWALAPDPVITADDRQILDKAVLVDGIGLSDRDITFALSLIHI